MYNFHYVEVKRVNNQSSFVALESGMVHYKNRIALDYIITKTGKNGMIDYKNYSGLDDIVIKVWKMESYITFFEDQNINHRLYFCFYKNGFNLPTVVIILVMLDNSIPHVTPIYTYIHIILHF